MSMYGEDYEYAHSRLTETIVRLNGEPVFIHNVSPGMVVQYNRLDGNGDLALCKADQLDLRPVPLGYCNYNKHACYLTRIPMRRDWRQGLRRGNFISLSGTAAERIPYDVLRQAILGDYPTFAAACEAVKKIKSIAWHRHWAVDCHGQLLHKGQEKPVGIVRNGEPELASKYMYLNEALKESL